LGFLNTAEGKKDKNSKFEVDMQKEEDMYGRSSRGLRVLSIKVRDIVIQKTKTSYKEVAEALVEEFHQSEAGVPLGVRPLHFLVLMFRAKRSKTSRDGSTMH
jgi:hypothetical protein